MKMKNNLRKWNKKGAVNTYRFIAMYLIIGVVIMSVTLMANGTTSDTTTGYKLNSLNRVTEIGQEKDKIISQSENTVKSNQFSLTNTFLNENAFGGNIAQAFFRGFLPLGLIPSNYQPSYLEYVMDALLRIFQSIIMFFAGYEVFQIIIKNKTT